MQGPNAAIDRIEKRATDAGIPVEEFVVNARMRQGENRGDRMPFRRTLTLMMPNGRERWPLRVYRRNFQEILESEFEQLIVLGKYQAVVNARSGKIEARISSSQRLSLGGAHVLGLRISRLQGIERFSPPELQENTGGGDALEEDSEYEEDWRLRLEKSGTLLEVSPSTKAFRAIFGNGVTLKIEGKETSSHDDALAVLELYSQSLLFDLDLVHGISAQVARRRELVGRRASTSDSALLKFPANRYSAEALQLYQYGRSAQDLPLLEFLAYYQSVEYFFPFYSKAKALSSLRTRLLDPRFDPSDDGELNRLLSISSTMGRGALSERDQLRAALDGCLTEDELVAFFNESPERMEHFSSKKQLIAGVEKLVFRDGAPSLRDQVADRVYGIRCRIVHAKQDGGVAQQKVLLPLGVEASALNLDIELLRYVAQKALISRATRF